MAKNKQIDIIHKHYLKEEDPDLYMSIVMQKRYEEEKAKLFEQEDIAGKSIDNLIFSNIKKSLSSNFFGVHKVKEALRDESQIYFENSPRRKD